MRPQRSFARSAKIGSEIRRMLRRRKAIVEEMQRIDRRIIALSRNTTIRVSLDDCTIIHHDDGAFST
ncbi:MAG: hypothetical protein OEY99_07535 [Aigarchaeota archaeon]|nr:hypothetical protein [Aigarchaeota archaeon]